MLLGLFFMSVGMSIDLALVGRQWRLLAIAASMIVAKTIIIAILSRLFGATWRDGLRSGALLCTAGESPSCFCPWQPGSASWRRPRPSSSPASAITMLLFHRFDPLRKGAREAPGRRALYGTERGAWPGKELASRVLVIGFGRFGQIVNQALLAQGIDATVIDKDVERIRDAGCLG